MCGFVPGAGDEGFWLVGKGVSGGVSWGGGVLEGREDVLCSGFQAMDFAGAECVPRTRSVVDSGFSLKRKFNQSVLSWGERGIVVKSEQRTYCLTCQSSPPLNITLSESPQQASSTGAACVNFTRSGFPLGLGPKGAWLMSYRRTEVSQEEAMR